MTPGGDRTPAVLHPQVRADEPLGPCLARFFMFALDYIQVFMLRAFIDTLIFMLMFIV